MKSLMPNLAPEEKVLMEKLLATWNIMYKYAIWTLPHWVYTVKRLALS
jgi:hypothetical protein